ncbi:putative protein c14, partial [Cardiosporidium cionae]
MPETVSTFLFSRDISSTRKTMNLLQKIRDQYSELWKAIIRPPRDSYQLPDLGPKFFRLRNVDYFREDLELRNNRDMALQCSHFKPIEKFRAAKKLPCIIYLHGNSSSRIESIGYIPELLSPRMTLFSLDFSGSGQSEGEYVSLGWWEREDLATVIKFLRNCGETSYIGLWGRSMGAVTALLHGHRDPSIAGMVLDSPFANLRLLAEELVEQFLSTKLPRFVVFSALGMLRLAILNKANFDIDHLSPADYVDRCFIPALFVVSDNDTFILPHHGCDLHAKYAGEKQIVTVKGDHNSVRPQSFIERVQIFFQHTLQRDFSTGGSSLPSSAFESSDEWDPFVSFSPSSMRLRPYHSNGQNLVGGNVPSSSDFSSDSEYFRHWEAPKAPSASSIYPSLSDKSNPDESFVTSSSSVSAFPVLAETLPNATTDMHSHASLDKPFHFPSATLPSSGGYLGENIPSIVPPYLHATAPPYESADPPSKTPAESPSPFYPLFDTNFISPATSSGYSTFPMDGMDACAKMDSAPFPSAPPLDIFSLRDHFRPPDQHPGAIFPSISHESKPVAFEGGNIHDLSWGLESMVKPTSNETVPPLHSSSDSPPPGEPPKPP